MKILPHVKKMTLQKDYLVNNHKVYVHSKAIDKDCYRYLFDILKQNEMELDATGININFIPSDFKKDQYKIEINQSGIFISYQKGDTPFIALTTLKQILAQSKERVPYLVIEDEPDFLHRGALLDISRNRVYKVKTIFKIIDLLTDLKMNQLQFNVEGKAFYYPQLDEIYDEKNHYFTAEDIKKIDAYCKSKKMEFVACQNSFGHMCYFLSLDKFHHLAECPEGFDFKWMINSQSTTLNPQLEESFDFVTSLYKEYIFHYSNNMVNICCDEPFELGLGRSKEIVEKEGTAKIYCDFVSKLINYLKENGKKAMIWGDVIKEHQEAVQLLPKDIICLEWGYDKDDFTDEKCQLYVQNNVDYYVCPGTSMWNSIVGIYDNMYLNCKNAAIVGKRNHASGYLLTDWGDGGSYQQLSLSYLPYAIGAAYAWNAQEDAEETVMDYLDREVYKCEAGSLSRYFKELGNSYHLEKNKESNATKLFKMVYFQHTDNLNFDTNLSDPLAINKDGERLSYEEYENYAKFFASKLEEIEHIQFHCDDEEIILREIDFSLRSLYAASLTGMCTTSLYHGTIDKIKEACENMKLALEDYKFTWKQRNKQSDYTLSVYRLNQFYKKLKIILE